MWSLQLTARAGAFRGYVPFEGLKLTRRILGGARVGFAADALDVNLRDLEIGLVLKLFEDSSLRFQGAIDDPLEDTATRVTVNAIDPFEWLEHRLVQATPLSSREFTNRDAALMMWDLIAAQDARADTFLRQAAAPATVQKTRTFEPGKVVAEAVREIADDAGVWFRVDPVDGVAGVQADFVTLYPGSGTDRPRARFEYGEETHDNLVDFKRTKLRPVNSVLAFGASEKTSLQSDAASQAAYGLIEEPLSLSAVNEQATLDSLAAKELIAEPRPVYSFEVKKAGGSALNDVFTPRPWQDFDVGDTVRLSLVGGRVDERDLSVRVNEFTVEVDDATSAARLTGVVFQEV